jgi:hypothetical protein
VRTSNLSTTIFSFVFLLGRKNINGKENKIIPETGSEGSLRPKKDIIQERLHGSCMLSSVGIRWAGYIVGMHLHFDFPSFDSGDLINI